MAQHQPYKHADMGQYWADAASIGPVLAHIGMFTGKPIIISHSLQTTKRISQIN